MVNNIRNTGFACNILIGFLKEWCLRPGMLSNTCHCWSSFIIIEMSLIWLAHW